MTPQEEIAPLGDVPVDIEVELDRRIMTTREVLQLEEGCVIGTSRSAGENIDIYIGGGGGGGRGGGGGAETPGARTPRTEKKKDAHHPTTHTLLPLLLFIKKK